MSTSVMRLPAKKISSCVRPGVCEVRARLWRPVSALMRLDLPTLERPANAISIGPTGGNAGCDPAAATKCQSAANSFRPASISSVLKSLMREAAPEKSGGAPNVARGVGHEAKLGDLVLDRHGMAADPARKPALRAQRKLLDGGVAARLVDASLQLVLCFQLPALGRDEPQHRGLAAGKQRSGSKLPARDVSYSR